MIGVLGVYVDDLMTMTYVDVMNAIVAAQRTWDTSEPEILGGEEHQKVTHPGVALEK